MRVDGYMDRDAVDEKLIRELIRAQHPDLAESAGAARSAIRLVPGGWDNQLWRLGEEMAVRLPMTGRAPGLLAKEFRWLPELGPRLPLPVPVPLRMSRPSDLFPRPWLITTWVPGEPADRAGVGDVGRTVANLAGFLRALHRPAPADAPVNPGRSGGLPSQADGFEARLAPVADAVDVRGVRRVWAEAVAAPCWAGPPLWIHADLHPANVLITDGALSGVVDFGELCAGDPAVDLSAAWRLLPPGAETEFFDAYGGIDEPTILRARCWAMLSALVFIAVGQAWECGRPGGQPTWGRVGRGMLERVLA